MYLCYLDESGTPESTDKSTHFVLLGIAIPAQYWQTLDGRIDWIKAKYGLADKEVHTGYLARRYNEQEKVADFGKLSATDRRTAATAERAKELVRVAGIGTPEHLKQLKKTYRHTEAYIHLTYDDRMNLLRELADEIATWGHARLFAEVIEKSKLAPHLDAFDFAFEGVVSRFHTFLKNRENVWLRINEAQAPGDIHFGLLIEDNNDTRARRLTDLMRKLHKQGTSWKQYVDHIIETPLFVNSHLTSMVQMADLCAYATRRFFEQGETDLIDRILPRFDRKGLKLVGIRHYTGASDCDCKICKAHG